MLELHLYQTGLHQLQTLLGGQREITHRFTQSDSTGSRSPTWVQPDELMALCFGTDNKSAVSLNHSGLPLGQASKYCAYISADNSQGNYLIKRQHVCAYINAHCRLHKR